MIINSINDINSIKSIYSIKSINSINAYSENMGSPDKDNKHRNRLALKAKGWSVRNIPNGMNGNSNSIYANHHHLKYGFKSNYRF